MSESIEAWLATFAALRPELLVLRDRREVVAACVLVRRTERRGPFFIRRAYINTSGEDVADSACIEFNDLLSKPGYERAMATALREHLRSTDEVHVPGMLEGPTLAALREAFADRNTVELPIPSYFIDLDSVRSGGKDWLDRLSSRERGKFRQAVRGYEAHGPLVLEQAASVAEAHAFLDGLATLHQVRWTERGKPGAFASPLFRSYHRALIERSFATGRIQLLRLVAGSTTIGYHYNFILDGKLYFYQCGYNYALDEKLRPGFVAHLYAIRHAMASGLTDYDFMAGDVEYKRRLAGGSRTMQWITWQADSVKMALFNAARELRTTDAFKKLSSLLTTA
ncbi:MAG: GNAT family N-acetyltransferase [Kofleriaceae bacterium]